MAGWPPPCSKVNFEGFGALMGLTDATENRLAAASGSGPIAHRLRRAAERTPYGAVIDGSGSASPVMAAVR
jgi:hypothetical protein